MSGESREDELWRHQDEMLDAVSSSEIQITNRLPIVDSTTAPPAEMIAPPAFDKPVGFAPPAPLLSATPQMPVDAAPVDDPHLGDAALAALEARVLDTLNRAVDAERRVAARDAALRTVAEAVEFELAQLDERARRVGGIRVEAEAEARRIVDEAAARARSIVAAAAPDADRVDEVRP